MVVGCAIPALFILFGAYAVWAKWNELHGVAVQSRFFLIAVLVFAVVLLPIVGWAWHKLANRGKEPIYSMSVQTEDFDNEPSEPVTASAALRAFDAFPWQKKLQDKRARDRRKKETSPPGLLFNGEGTHLNIGITGEDEFWLHAKIPVPRGLRQKWYRGDTVEIKNITLTQAREYTQAFFRKDYLFIAKGGKKI